MHHSAPVSVQMPQFTKNADGLLPAIIQHAHEGWILMQGYMNKQSFEQTLDTKQVTFFSRSKQRIWVKGETSGHYLRYHSHFVDCDADSILIFAVPQGPTCHTGATTCYGEPAQFPFVSSPLPQASVHTMNTPTSFENDISFLTRLEAIIEQRKQQPDEKSYVAKMFRKGVAKMAQKVGEEATELVIEAMQTDNEQALHDEAADLLFHYLILLNAKGTSLARIAATLEARHSTI